MASTIRFFRCKTTSGLASVLGNMSLIIRDFFLKTFPKNFFNSIYIDTKLQQLDLEKADVIKKKSPILIIRPRFDIGDNTIFETLPQWMNTNYFIYKKLKGNYLPVFNDSVNEIYVYSAIDRIKVDFDIEIVTLSRMQQLNTAYWIKGSFLHKAYFYLYDNVIESEVPKYFVKTIGQRLGYDLKNNDERKQLEDYLSSHSQSLIVEKIKSSSGNPTWFYSYKTNILCKAEDYPAIDDGRDINMIKDFFKTSFTMNTEIWCPNNYFLELKDPDSLFIPPSFDETEGTGMDFVFNYAYTFKIPERKDQKDLFASKSFICEIDSGEDELDIRLVFTQAMQETIKYILKRPSLKIKDYFDIDVYKERLIVSSDYITIDWDNLKLINNHPEKTTFTLVLYADIKLMNELIYRRDMLRQTIYQK